MAYRAPGSVAHVTASAPIAAPPNTARLPESWRVRGGVTVPMHQAEAVSGARFGGGDS